MCMKTKAIRLYGKNDIRLEEFELPEMQEDEILAQIVSDSICMSSYKAAIQGPDHKRVPNDVDKNPIILGHEFSGKILKVGKKWEGQFQEGQKYSIQPAIAHKDNPYAAPGYSFKYIGGGATHVIIPNVVMEAGALLPYEADSYFYGSLAEPMSTIIGAFRANYHHVKPGSYEHEMGVKPGGNMAILAGVGPMGLGAIDYALHNEKKPKLLVVTDINEERLARAASIYTVEDAAKNGVKLVYVNTTSPDKGVDYMMSLSDGKGYDDVFIFAPVKAVVEMGNQIMGYDACMNFFAGPTDQSFSANFNFYDVHYSNHHIVGTSGGNTEDLKISLDMMGKGKINPIAMITHVGGLNSAPETTLNLPNIPGGKKLVYTNIEMDMAAINDFREKGKTDPLFAKLADIVEKNNGLWSAEAEKYLLANSKPI